MNDFQNKIRQRRFFLGQEDNAVFILIAFNIAFFILLFFIQVVYESFQVKGQAFENNVLSWFTMPLNFQKLMTRPWTLLTYQFTHIKFLTFLGHLFWLWVFGNIMQDLTGNYKIIPLYIYGGLCAALVHLTAASIFPNLVATAPFLYNATYPILAIAVATTTLAPDFRFYPMINGGIPIWIITLVYALLSLFNTGTPTLVNVLPILTAGFFGFLFINQLHKGNDWSIGFNQFFSWLSNMFNPNKTQAKNNFKAQLFYKTNKAPFKKTPQVTQKRIDEILDKINTQGYHFLTTEEKNILKRAAEKN
jgi:membrane associated rhomboid family serine protease